MRPLSFLRASLPAAAALLFAAPGCASTRLDNVRVQTADDFHCPSADVVAERIGRGRWRATGCRRTAVYLCSQRQCEREPEPSRPPPTPSGRTPMTWSDEAALAALRAANGDVMACVPERGEPLTLRVELRSEGRVGRVGGLNELSTAEARCVREALSEVQIAARVDVARVVRFAFGAASDRPTPSLPVQTAGGGPVPQPAVGVAPVPAPPPSASPPAPRPGEAELRATLVARTDVVLACVSGNAVAVVVDWSGDGAVQVSMQGPLAGSAEEGCVRQALSTLTMPAGAPGRLIHPFSR